MKVKFDYNIDEGRVYDEITEKFYEIMEEKLLKEAKKTLDNRLNSLVDKEINELLKDFLHGREIIITDQWGNIKSRYVNAIELLQEKFDNYLSQEVDDRGKPVKNSCGYDSKTRIEHVIDNSVSYNFQALKKEIYNKAKIEFENRIKSIKKEIVTETLNLVYDKVDLKKALKE